MNRNWSSVYERLREYIDNLTIIDTHEHLPPFEVGEKRDVLSAYLTHYLSSDLISAGLSRKDYGEIVCNENVPLTDKWRAIEPFWRYARHTGYGRAIALTAEGLYGIEVLNADSIEELNKRFLDSHQKGNHYRHVLKEKCKIETSILDGWCDNADKEFFRIATQVHGLVYGPNGDLWNSIQNLIPCQLTTFDDLLAAVESYVEGHLQNIAVCLKCSLAYERSLHFPQTGYSEALEELGYMRASKEPEVWKNCSKLQNYMLHHVLKTVNRTGGVVQFHTGLQEGNGNFLEWTNPAHLTNLFLAYPNVKFDLFHMGYPFQNITAALAKNFPNVYIDMCWAHIISPADSILALEAFLDTVPFNKISAFGGDYCFVDGVYGHLTIARDNIAKALAKKVCAKQFDLQEACFIAERMLYSNPKEIFGL